GSAPRRPRPPGDGSAPGRGPKTRPARATRLDWRVYPWVSSFFIQGSLMQVKTNKVVSMSGSRHLAIDLRHWPQTWRRAKIPRAHSGHGEGEQANHGGRADCPTQSRDSRVGKLSPPRGKQGH